MNNILEQVPSSKVSGTINKKDVINNNKSKLDTKKEKKKKEIEKDSSNNKSEVL